MAAGEQSGDLAEIWRKDGIEHGTKNCREAGMGTWPLGFGLLSFCYACLRFDDFNVVRFWAGRLIAVHFGLRQLRPDACGDLCGIDLVPGCRPCEVRVFLLKGLDSPHPLVGIRQTLLRLSHSSVLVCGVYERTVFYWQFMGSSSRKDCHCRQTKRTVRCMQILQRPHLQGFMLSC